MRRQRLGETADRQKVKALLKEDNPGWKQTRLVALKMGVHIVTRPPYSPELNPIEKLWDLIQDHTANKLWPTITRLDEVVGLHLKDWWEDPHRVISLFGNGWIHAPVNAT